MKLVVRILMLTLTLIGLMGLTTVVALAQDPDNGKVVWEEQSLCQRCHGSEGQGNWGPPLAGRTSTVEEWIAQVRTPRRSMPSFSAEQVSDAAITDIHAYLTALPEPASFTLPDAGLAADAHEGQKLIVEKRCVACHSTTGPINFFIERGEIPTTEAVLAQLRNPRQRMPTFSTGQVSDAEAAIIAEFLAQQVTEQLPPPALPTSGGNISDQWLLLVLAGVTLLLSGSGLLLKFSRVPITFRLR